MNSINTIYSNKSNYKKFVQLKCDKCLIHFQFSYHWKRKKKSMERTDVQYITIK